MKVFISWSGERSRAIAEALHDWLPFIINALQPFMSANDIEKGARWRAGLASELEATSISIICLTPENLNATWIHFEAGALSKQQSSSHVCTYLYELEPVDLREPLAQFQATKAQKDDTKKLINTINHLLGSNALASAKLNESFEVWWPRLEGQLAKIPPPNQRPVPVRDTREILEDILELVREQGKTADSREILEAILELVGEQGKTINACLQEINSLGFNGVAETLSVNELNQADLERLIRYLRIPDHRIQDKIFIQNSLYRLLDALEEEEERDIKVRPIGAIKKMPKSSEK